MRKLKRRYVLLLIALVVIASALLCLTVFRQRLAIAYHQWRMNAEYNTIFADPEPAGGGLASYDVSGVDVDAVMERYMDHRQALVDLGVLSHLAARFPRFNDYAVGKVVGNSTMFLMVRRRVTFVVIGH